MTELERTKSLDEKEQKLRERLEQIAAWAEEDFRSINGQIEFLLSQAVLEKYKKK